MPKITDKDREIYTNGNGDLDVEVFFALLKEELTKTASTMKETPASPSEKIAESNRPDETQEAAKNILP